MTKERAIKVINVFLGNDDLCACDENCLDVSCKECRREAAQMAIEALKEQITGKWIIFPPCFEEICMCSNCKTKFKEAYQHRDTCPSCGARMMRE